MKLKMMTWIGIHLSGPRRFETSCEGSSATKKPSLDKVFPKL